MNKDTNYLFSPTKRMRLNVTCLLDLSDEILLLICRYLSPFDVLDSFYTSERPELRLHRVISDYYTKIKLSGLPKKDYHYLLSLFCRSNFLPRLESLILSNEHVTCLTQHFFTNIRTNIIYSMFKNLKSLQLIDCTSEDLTQIHSYFENPPQLEYLHIRIRKNNEKRKIKFVSTSINQIIFDERMSSIHTLVLEVNNGLALNKSLISHQNLRNLNLILQTIDDLYILLDGLVPNIQTLIVQLCQRRILSGFRPRSTSLCSRLREFRLLEPRIGFLITDLKCILVFMPNLNKLMLSIRDTPDPLFCHGPNFESILAEYLPYLRHFDCTMTHRIIDQQLIEDFVCWPMNSVYYENENCRWIHIYSLPWPSSLDDQRRLPIVRGGSHLSVRSEVKRSEYMEHVLITKSEEFSQLKSKFVRARQVTTCLSIDIELPLRISQLILSEGTRISSLNSIVQPSIRHLIVQCCLNDVDQLAILARLFPHVNYLELLFPLPKSLFGRFLQNIFSIDNTSENKFKLWPKLIHLTSHLCFQRPDDISDNKTFRDWLIENTDLKYRKDPFYALYLFSKTSIWF